MRPPKPPRPAAPPSPRPVIVPPRPPRQTVIIHSHEEPAYRPPSNTTSTSGTGSTVQAAGRKDAGGRKKPPYGILAATAIIVAILCAVFGCFMSRAKDGGQRQKLEASACISMDRVVEDRLGWLDDTEQVTEAIQYFYDKTGVQPYLLICSSLDGKGGEIMDGEAEEALRNLYESMYADEGHMIYAFMEYADSEYITWIYTGRAADAVIDSEAREIFLNNADRLYTDSSLTDDEYFAETFERSADQIMADKSAGRKVLAVCMALSGIMAAASLAGFLWLAMKDAKHREREQLKEFLDAPIGQSQEAQDLENKYQ